MITMQWLIREIGSPRDVAELLSGKHLDKGG